MSFSLRALRQLRGRRKGGDEEEDVALDVRPELVQSKDLLVRTHLSTATKTEQIYISQPPGLYQPSGRASKSFLEIRIVSQNKDKFGLLSKRFLIFQ